MIVFNTTLNTESIHPSIQPEDDIFPAVLHQKFPEFSVGLAAIRSTAQQRGGDENKTYWELFEGKSFPLFLKSFQCWMP